MKARVYNLTHQMIADPRRQLPEEAGCKGVVVGTALWGESFDEIELDYYARKELLAALKLIEWYKEHLMCRLEENTKGAAELEDILWPVYFYQAPRVTEPEVLN